MIFTESVGSVVVGDIHKGQQQSYRVWGSQTHGGREHNIHTKFKKVDTVLRLCLVLVALVVWKFEKAATVLRLC